MDPTTRSRILRRGPFISRLWSAMLLRRELYESVAADPSELRPAIAVVLVSAVVQYSLLRTPLPEDLTLWTLVIGMFFAMIRWLIYAALFYPLARIFTSQKGPFPRLLRCLGFAEAPGIARATLFFVDASAAGWVNLVVTGWLFASSVVAARAALSTSLLRAVLITAVSFFVYQLLGILTYV